MEMMYYQQLGRSSYRESLKVLESDIQHANDLAASIPKAKGGTRLEMKLVYNKFTPLLFYFLQWIDCSCTCFLPKCFTLFHILIYKVYTDGKPKLSKHGRKATIKEFYAVILPSLQQLDEGNKHGNTSAFVSEQDDECGICLEPCTKMVMPNCCHSMCINCYRDWSMRSESCPFCRGSLRRVKSQDLWVLPCKDEVIDQETISTQEVQRFYLYVQKLPKDYPDSLFLMYYEYLI